MIHNTRGIVLKTVKYGETSLICTLFTELLGLQSFLLKGVRSTKGRNNKANQFFPASILQLSVYHQPQRNLQSIRESHPAYIYQNLQTEVVKNCVSLFAIEAIGQFLASDDPQYDLFAFLQHFLIALDQAPNKSIANYPIYFLVRTGKLAGYFLEGKYSGETPYVDLLEGRFSSSPPQLPPVIEGEEAKTMQALNDAGTLEAIESVALTASERQKMLHYFLAFLQFHVPHFKPLKSLPVLASILSV